MFQELKNADSAEELAFTKEVHAASSIDASGGSDSSANFLRRAQMRSRLIEKVLQLVVRRRNLIVMSVKARQAPFIFFGHQQP
ncbi:hypothetical protein CCR75_009113 [Bremia lactucae]|uniref:Uncharacterized protein n=1 Tax=Bremia lactucae TaxID=4779 RepID=A0A976IB50_BRELC|nr:hypothetical protein CCR75_009113 [Bremia lactucae]